MPPPDRSPSERFAQVAAAFVNALQRGYVKALKDSGVMELVGVAEDGRPLYALDPSVDEPGKATDGGT